MLRERCERGNMWHLKSVKSGFLWAGLLSGMLLAFPSFSQEFPDFSKIILDSRQAVVSITTQTEEGKKLVPDELLEDLEDTPLMDVLKQIYGERLAEKLSGKTPTLASGTIISADGYIVTNYHVVENANKDIVIRLHDREEYLAKIIGTDPLTDLALLKIQAKNLPYLSFADSNQIKVGEWVIAIGSPYGFENSVTTGIVSATGRSLVGEKYIPFIQTDVAINPGNSGGPLLNLKGEVIGINSQILSNSGSYVGLSFAMPANFVKSVIKQLKEKGNVTRGWVGVALQQIDRNLASSFGMAYPKGALIARVEPNSPAEKAGLIPGDVITEFNDQAIIEAADLPPLIGISPLNTKIKVKYLRDNQEKEVSLILKTYKEEKEVKKEVSPILAKIKTPVVVRDVEAFEASTSSFGEKGVVVMELRVPTWKEAGIRRGDRILAINNTPVSNSQQFYTILKEHKDKPMLALLVAHEGQVQRYLTVKQ